MTSTYRRAIDVIDRRGWQQGALIDGTTGCVDILGACVMADGIVPDDPHAQLAVGDAVTRHSGLLADLIDPERPSRSIRSAVAVITEWNDDPDRTDADVRKLLSEAADITDAVASAYASASQHDRNRACPGVATGVVKPITGPLAGATTMTEASPILPASERTHVAGVPPIVVRRRSLLRRLLDGLLGVRHG